ncbi:MAG: SpoIID/LytB domain-containing protein, partial [Bdellovibrionota bacterium]|nr:SpoIID/LytB domain-containing protein [Bdellovibrionota bacterium]
MRLFSILTLSLFFLGSAWSFNDISPVQSQSPLLNDGPWGIDLPEKISPLQIRVLIFPHTLKKDYRHGVPDNPHKLKIFSESPIKSGSQVLGKNLTFTFNKSKGFKIKGEGLEKEINSRFIKLTSESPISLFREKNPKKTHKYVGKIAVRANKLGLFVVNHITIEDYLKGVVPNEVVKTWPIEVLKAQAVAARTYAVYHSLSGQDSAFWDVDDTARYQVFTGVTHSVSKTNHSVMETK